MNQFDVIVVGGGLAGVCAAEQALRAGAKTALVTKGWLGGIGVRGSGASGCGATEGGRPAFFDGIWVVSLMVVRLREEVFYK